MEDGIDAPVVPLEAYAQGLRTVARSVVRVSLEADNQRLAAMATAWFITPSIVVMPSHVIDDARVETLIVDQGEAWRERITVSDAWLSKDEPEAGVIALYRMPHASVERGLPLSLQECQPDDRVSIVQYPIGGPAALSHGRIVDVLPRHLAYDAGTSAGSSGSPVLDLSLRVVAVHFEAGMSQRIHRGISSAALLDILVTSPLWQEIAAFHRLADPRIDRIDLAPVTAAPSETASAALLRAAVRGSVPRAELDPEARDAIRASVVDATAEHWILRPDARRSALAAAPSLDALRTARDTAPAADELQRVIDRVLVGPPFDVESLAEDELARWIQVASWFRDVRVIDDLPSPAVMAAILERKRMRSRLATVASTDFQGRDDQLALLRAWSRDATTGPAHITGIGGIGKSSLAAKFALSLPEDTLLLWLDFDRPDLAPDDAVSIIAALREQAEVQLVGFRPPAMETARDLGQEIIRCSHGHRPLLVLDSFEVAQYQERYQELWPVLEELDGVVSGLRVIVIGRAIVPGLQLRGRRAVPVVLRGLADSSARAWLASKRITRPDIVEQVLELAAGIPLILKLATLLVERGGSVSDLPARLPREVIDGMLYQRVLDRVIDPELKPVAMALLVLRRLSPDMVDPVLRGVFASASDLRLPERPIEQWFSDLRREVALIEGLHALRLRREVRAAALPLLARDQPDLVAALDRAAVAWYATRDTNDPAIAAELVYHHLRLRDPGRAAAAWRDGCGIHLQDAADEIRPADRGWLIARLGTGSVHDAPPLTWEEEAAERIRGLLARGLERNIAAVLAERSERNPDSPLVFYDAYHAMRAGDLGRALTILKPPARRAHVLRDRNVLKALVLSKLGDRFGADELLAALDRPELWQLREHLQALHASRIAALIDIELELALFQLRNERSYFELWRILAPMDAVLPALVSALKRDIFYEITSPLHERLRAQLFARSDEGVAEEVERLRRSSLADELGMLRGARERGILNEQAYGSIKGVVAEHACRVAVLGWRRWQALLQTSVAREVAHPETQGLVSDPHLRLSILAPIALATNVLSRPADELVTTLNETAREVGFMEVPDDRWQWARHVLRVGAAIEFHASVRRAGEVDLIQLSKHSEARGIVFFLLAPPILELLVERLAMRAGNDLP